MNLFEARLILLLRRLLPAFSALLFLTSPGICDSEAIDEVVNDADRWIELQSRISEEAASWQAEKEILETSLLVLHTENKNLLDDLNSNRIASELYLKNRDNIVSSMEEQRLALDFVTDRAVALEARAQSIARSLPEPLARDLGPLFRKLDAGYGDRSLSTASRMQTLASIFAQIDKFNNSLTLTHQIRPSAEGSDIDVRILYWGLAFAYAIDAQGETAWVVSPDEGGWQWTERSDLAEEIETLMNVYEKRAQPSLTTLPLKIN